MNISGWYGVIGLLLLLIALLGGRISRWPLTTAMIYLAIGVLFGRLGWVSIDFIRDAQWLEIASEIAIIISLFSAGLKLRSPLTSKDWRLPLALATLAMAATVALIAGTSIVWFGLPLGVAVVLGAILAPTDPVLASDVQVAHTRDTDPVRFTLTGEAGLNDGIAFPFLLLGLGLLGQHELGAFGMHWILFDLLWKIFAGLIIGLVVGGLTTYLVLYLRRRHGDAVGFDDFIALGLIASTYGLASTAHSYGFIAVFAAGWSVRAVERRASFAKPSDPAPPDVEDEQLAVDEIQAPAYLAAAILKSNDHMDHIGELALVLLVGALLASMEFHFAAAIFAIFLFLLIRPLAVAPFCALSGMRLGRITLVSWFGIRGIGSIYYLAYAMTHGLPTKWAQTIVSVTLTVIAISTLLHGLTSTPAMRVYAGESMKWTRRFRR